MNTPSQSTVGSTIYVVDRTVSPTVVVAIPSLKGLSAVGGGKAKKNDKSNFDTKNTNEVSPGRSDPPEGTGELILMKNNVGHQRIKKLFEAGTGGQIDGFDIFVGDGDGVGVPTLVGVGKVLTPPKVGSPGATWARSGTLGRAYFSNFTPKKADDEFDRCDIAVQWSGGQTWVVKGEPIAKTY